MKKCKTCKKVLPYDKYGKHSETADGYKGSCNVCLRVVTNEYKRSKSGLPARIYNNQKVNSKRRGHPAPDYGVKELRAWLTAQPLFHTLYAAWEASGYERDLVPSCDRKDDSKPYTLSNLTLMTWKENKAKGHQGTRDGSIYNPTLLGGGHKEVTRVDKVTGECVTFISQSEAARCTPGVYQGNIAKVIQGKIKSTGGYLWR
jgi:hypothetical protein